jgi:NAD-dependent protein deacetylase/lipoamidase
VSAGSGARARPRHLVVLTGAGISAESGLPTFRGAGGLWEGRAVEEVATPQAWERNPRLVWRFYQERRAQLGRVRPNAAHEALSRLQTELERAGDSLTLVTQNVDGLHERAGSRPLAMRGSLARLVCERCGAGGVDLVHLDPEAFVPCRSCDFERLRPDVVWFGELPHHLEEIEEALTSATDFLAVGTSGAVWPAAGFLQTARRWGARTYVNALEPPENLDPRDVLMEGEATGVLPRFVAEFLSAPSR